MLIGGGFRFSLIRNTSNKRNSRTDVLFFGDCYRRELLYREKGKDRLTPALTAGHYHLINAEAQVSPPPKASRRI